MPSQVLTSVENQFTKGLITESTGLNFPENAATDTDNCEYTLVGDVLRREGIDLELHHSTQAISRDGCAISTYKWNNAGGDGNTQLLVQQIGSTLYFYRITSATVALPLSWQFLATQVDFSSFVANGGVVNIANECTYSDGNGYLFVFHPDCEPFYCSLVSNTVTASPISVKIRDFTGVQDSLQVNTRPTTLTAEHSYNLTNQGWVTSPGWFAQSGITNVIGGPTTFTVQAGLSVVNGQVVTGTSVSIINIQGVFSGTVTSYSGTTLVVNVTSYSYSQTPPGGGGFASWNIVPSSTGYVSTWFGAEGNYPSNADVWWRFKNAAGAFDPATTQPNVTLSLGQAPQGHFVVSAFNIDRSSISGTPGLTAVSTTNRPTIGTWFQGRVWFAGTNASFAATGDASSYSWSENIYFSQVNISTTNNFGSCFQVNDPTSEELNGILPTDGGVITIQGCGRIFKLFPIQNGMLVFAANGVWFITGSQGIGFSASDYTITKISNVESMNSTSYVDVMGLPFFWNEEGIYQVEPQQSGGLAVNPITVGTILSFYNDIPKQSKKYVRGAYNAIDYVVQWIYKSDNDTSVNDRYSFNKILNYNVYNKAFFPYTVDISGGASINGINYIQAPGGTNSPEATFKYVASVIVGSSFSVSIAEEYDTTYTDWRTALGPVNYTSYFVTGYKLHGQGQRRFQMPYIYLYNRFEDNPNVAYYIQGLWDYASDRNSNRWSVPQFVNVTNTHFSSIFKRHRIRGRGIVLQIKVTSVDGQPFDIMGWSVFESQNAGI